MAIVRLPNFPRLRLCAALLTALSLPVLCSMTYAQQERVFFGILYSHSAYCDGSGTPREAY